MDSWQTAILVVACLTAGALLSVLVQLSMTLRSARAALEKTSLQLGRALDSVAATAERLDRVTAGIDERRVHALMESFEALARSVNHFRESVRVGSAVAAAMVPAVGAAVKAWRAGRPEHGDQHDDAGSAADGKEEAR